MSSEQEPLKITQVHAALDKHGTWEVTVRSQRSRITLHRRPEPIAAMQHAAERVLRGENDDQWSPEDGPRAAS